MKTCENRWFQSISKAFRLDLQALATRSEPSGAPKRSRSWLEECSSALEADRLEAELRKAAKVVDLEPATWILEAIPVDKQTFTAENL